MKNEGGKVPDTPQPLNLQRVSVITSSINLAFNAPGFHCLFVSVLFWTMYSWAHATGMLWSKNDDGCQQLLPEWVLKGKNFTWIYPKPSIRLDILPNADLFKRLQMLIIHFRLQVTWRGQNIVVFNDVIIKPPYKLEDVNGSPDSKQFTYVKKMVEKFLKDQQSVSAEVTTWTVSVKNGIKTAKPKLFKQKQMKTNDALVASKKMY